MAQDKVRVQLDLSPAEAEALDGLRDACGLRSRADAVRTALAVIAWIRSEAEAGKRVVAVDADGVSHLVLPGVTV